MSLDPSGDGDLLIPIVDDNLKNPKLARTLAAAGFRTLRRSAAPRRL
jgi:hypothetical protein